MSLGRFLGFGEILDRAIRTRNNRDSRVLDRLLSRDLVAHDTDVLRRRADKGQAVSLDDFGKTGILGQKTVAGMNRIRARDFTGRDDSGNIEVAIRAGRRTHTDALVSEAHMHGVLVRGRMDRDR